MVCQKEMKFDRLSLTLMTDFSSHSFRLVISAFLLVAVAVWPVIDLVAQHEVVLSFSFHVFRVGWTGCVFVKIDNAMCNVILAAPV